VRIRPTAMPTTTPATTLASTCNKIMLII
jgi:hypothetical protein